MTKRKYRRLHYDKYVRSVRAKSKKAGARIAESLSVDPYHNGTRYPRGWGSATRSPRWFLDVKKAVEKRHGKLSVPVRVRYGNPHYRGRHASGYLTRDEKGQFGALLVTLKPVFRNKDSGHFSYPIRGVGRSGLYIDRRGVAAHELAEAARLIHGRAGAEQGAVREMFRFGQKVRVGRYKGKPTLYVRRGKQDVWFPGVPLRAAVRAPYEARVGPGGFKVRRRKPSKRR